MFVRSALASATLALAVGASGAFAAAPAAKHHAAAMKPSIAIKSVTAKGSCVTVSVSVAHFALRSPVYKPPLPMLKGNQGHIHYVLNGVKNFVATRDAGTKLSHTWCGKAQGVKKGMDSVMVYLATSMHTQFPGTKAVTRTVMVH